MTELLGHISLVSVLSCKITPYPRIAFLFPPRPSRLCGCPSLPLLPSVTGRRAPGRAHLTTGSLCPIDCQRPLLHQPKAKPGSYNTTKQNHRWTRMNTDLQKLTLPQRREERRETQRRKDNYGKIIQLQNHSALIILPFFCQLLEQNHRWTRMNTDLQKLTLPQRREERGEGRIIMAKVLLCITHHASCRIRVHPCPSVVLSVLHGLFSR